jgi:hypothetical protein
VGTSTSQNPIGLLGLLQGYLYLYLLLKLRFRYLRFRRLLCENQSIRLRRQMCVYSAGRPADFKITASELIDTRIQCMTILLIHPTIFVNYNYFHPAIKQFPVFQQQQHSLLFICFCFFLLYSIACLVMCFFLFISSLH